MEVLVDVLLGWLLLTVVVAVVIGRGLRLAATGSTVEPMLTTADLPADFRANVGSSPR